MELDEFYMSRCIQLAQRGIGVTRPNPSVGCVIVYNGNIIAEGYTSSYGGPHAEVNAVRAVKDVAVLSDSIMYVTLEPCSHFGKTPPCAHMIVKHKIRKVVIGCVDSNSLVAGKGIEYLLSNGCDVKVGVLEKQCFQHHKRFFTNQNKKRPYIVLKWAQTADGFIAPLKKDINRPVWISNSYSQQIVHKWRSEEHAILVGTTTAILDNPKLDTRRWGGKLPIRVVLDRNLRIPSSNGLFDGSAKTIVCVDVKNLDKVNSKSNLFFEGLDFSQNISEQICDILMKHNIQSIIVEGGAKMLQTFIDASLWDEARVLHGEISFGDGLKSPLFSQEKNDEYNVRGTKVKIYYNSPER